MGELVGYVVAGSVATITMDDGKVNVLSRGMQAELSSALDQAESDRAVVVIRGRQGVFSAGFDLNTLRAGGSEAMSMLRGGFELSSRVLSHPCPVLTVCTGHALAMGLFLLLSGDYVVGIDGPYRIAANEVAIGLPIPRSAIAVMRNRMAPSVFTRASLLAETFDPSAAKAAGILDTLVDDDQVDAAVAELAARFASLDMTAHAASKRLVRTETLAQVRNGMDLEFGRGVTD